MKRIILLICAILALLLLVFLALAPGLVKNYINKNGEKIVGRTVHIEKIKINYFTSTLRVVDFELFEKNGTDVFAQFDSLLVDLKPLRLLKNEIHVQQFQIVNSFAQITQNDTLFNFSDIVDHFMTKSETESLASEDKKESYLLNLNLIEVKNGGISYLDIPLDHTVSLHEVSFIIPRIYWGDREKSKADVYFKLGRGGSFSSTFDYDTESGDFAGSIQLKELDLGMILPYVQQYIDFAGIEGKFDSEIEFTGNEYDLEKLNLKGIARVDSVWVTDSNNRKVLGIEKAKASVSSFFPLKYHAVVDTLLLENPYAYVALIDSTINFQNMLIPEEELGEETAVEEESAYDKQIVLNRLIVENGLVDFNDQRLYENFEYELSKISVDMDTITLEDDWINVNATMKLNKRGDLNAKIGMNPFNPEESVNLEYVISDFQLPDLNIYSKYYTGLPILFGDMYYVGKTSISNKQLESENELIIRNVEMGRKTGGLYDVPIKLALFILKDINGDIVLDIPVSGDLSDPKTNIRAIVWDTFKGFMFKIVASPFKALGGLLNANPKDLEEISMNYSDTVLLKQHEKNLDLLLELEQLKPELKIEMQYLNDRKLERTDVAAVLLQEQFYEKYNKRANLNRKAYQDFLAKESGRDSMLIQDYELLLASKVEVDSIIQEREENRLGLFSTYLVTKNDSTQIIIQGYNEAEPLNVGSRPRFLIKYALAEEQD